MIHPMPSLATAAPGPGGAAAYAPSHEHGFSDVEVHQILDGIYERGDRLMLWFLASHMALAIVLALFHQTWFATITVGGAALGVFALSVRLFPRTFFTRALAGVAQQAYVALHIFQLHGQAEQHFWYFTAFTMMIVYQDWLCMWPGALLIILQHTVFAFLHNAGFGVHFFPEAHVGFSKLFFHFGIALVHVGICGYWAHLLRMQTLGDAWRQRQLREDQGLLESQVAALKVSEVALTASTARLDEASRLQRAILDNSPDVMWVMDLEHRYTAVNSAFERAIGRPRAEIEGRPAAEVATAASLEKLTPQLEQAIASRRPVTREDTFIVRGEPRAFEVTITPVFDEHGGLAGTTGTAHDVTEQRRLEAERSRSAQRLQESQKAESIGLLAGGVAHDFNNLLGVIKANAELARLDLPEGSPARESFAEIERSTQRAADLTRQMLAYAGLGQVAVDRLDPSALVRGTAELFRSVVPKKVELRIELASDAPVIEGDATQLRQVVMNLISNAADSIGDAEGRVVVRTARVRVGAGDLQVGHGQPEPAPGTYALIEVTDTGAGMSPETLSRIFDPFFTTKFTGRGLGLAAALGILRAHRGAIEITSEPGRGSAFRVYLPGVQGVARATPTEPVSAMPERAGRKTPPGTVLVVDDEPSLRSLASRVLQRAGHSVETAADGVEALEQLAAKPAISAVLLDMLMPRLGGEETLRAIRERHPALPVLLTSGFSEAVAAERLLAHAHVAFIQKPYGAGQLIGALGKLVDAARDTNSDGKK